MESFYTIGSEEYLICLAILVFGRGADFLSTWIATPNLLLEGNPIAKKLGWKLGIVVNTVVCLAFASWPFPAIVIATTSVLVAARNFQHAWLMRTLGEYTYRQWMAAQIAQTPLGLYLFCILAQTGLTATVGLALVCFSRPADLIPFAVGVGILTYSLAIAFYTLLSVRRMRKRHRDHFIVYESS